ncbi:MAG: hypothetical protein LWW79_13785 [Holophagaceae bacterium]|nr:hypothetical protein [Holophagaceae bacterium]
MRKRLIHCLLSLAALSSTAPGALASPPTRSGAAVVLKDGWYYLKGRKCLINAIGYESGARPGEVPYETPGRNLAQVRRDLRIIKAAGFNGIRTWSQMSEAELKVVQASGLKVIFGIWLKPDEDFSDAQVVEKNLALIRQVLGYSHKYDCVITYLIMNEPMPEHLRKVGALATRDLWARATGLIHELHPGIPVTISGNTAITEWLDMNLFDVYARNAYDYRDGANFTHGFAQSQRAITESLGQGKPVLLTEFGRSVSRQGSGLYGGNTLEQQAEAMVRYYRDILDSGATGLCPFYYADGWWKSGAPAIHNDEAEEWFGLLGFRNLKDTVGYPRPAWHALKRYNQALITSPKNQAFYRNEVPVEAFCQAGVKRLRVVHLDALIAELTPDAHGYVSGTLLFPGEGLRDRELVIEALDATGRLLKHETLIVLTGKDPVSWPRLEIRTPVTDLDGLREVPVEVELWNDTPFNLGEEVRYAFSHHKGWDRAEARVKAVDPKQKHLAFADAYAPPQQSPMLAIYAGIDVRFGKFSRTIRAHRYLYPGTWADPIRVKE